MLAALAPATKQGGPGFEQPKGSSDKVVEVEPARIFQGRFVGEECPGDWARFGIGSYLLRRDADVELEPAERVVEASDRAAVDVGPHVAQHRLTVQQRIHGLAAVGENLAAQGVERLHANGSGRKAARLKRRVHARRHLVGGPLVERDGRDGRRIRARGHEPRDPGNEGRGLPTPGGGHAQHRPRRRGCGRPLVRRELLEAFGNRGGEHRGSIGGIPYRRLIGPRRALSGEATRATIVDDGPRRRPGPECIPYGT